MLATNLRDLRGLNHLSQPELVERMVWLGHEWGQSTASLVERGRRNVTADELVSLALVYGRTLDELFDPAGVTGDAPTALDLGDLPPLKAEAARTWLRGRMRVKLVWDVKRPRWVAEAGDESVAGSPTTPEEALHSFRVSPAPPAPEEWPPTDQNILLTDREEGAE